MFEYELTWFRLKLFLIKVLINSMYFTLVIGKSKLNPKRSVSIPGVKSKRPPMSTHKPWRSPFPGILPLFNSNWICLITFRPCSLAKYAPTIPVTTIRASVAIVDVRLASSNRMDNSTKGTIVNRSNSFPKLNYN